MTTNPIPETHRRRALFGALYHHDGIGSYAGGECDGNTITVEIRPAHPDQPGPGLDSSREFVKRIANALGFSFASQGPFQVVLRPDLEHALAGLRSLPDPGDSGHLCELCTEDQTAHFRAADGTAVCATHADALESGNWDGDEHELEPIDPGVQPVAPCAAKDCDRDAATDINDVLIDGVYFRLPLCPSCAAKVDDPDHNDDPLAGRS